MPKKKETAPTPPAPEPTAAYVAALKIYVGAMEAMRNGDFDSAAKSFDEVATDNRDEPELAERARTYAKICRNRTAPPPPDPTSNRERFLRAVVLSNDGRWDEAIQLLNEALREDPMSVDCLYARSSTWALKGAAEKAVEDLRQAILVEPSVRFQAVNDPDFERIREEPSFIDIIEPTPTEA